MYRKLFIISLLSLPFFSCVSVFTRINKEQLKNYDEFRIDNDSIFVVKSISLLERLCFDCVPKKDFPIALTNDFGTKNIENINGFIAKLNQKGFKIKIDSPALNDSLFFYSKQEWTKRIWGKKPPPQNINGNILIISTNYFGSIGLNGHAGMSTSRTVFEFVKLQNSEVVSFSSFVLKKGLSYENPLIKYRDLKKIFKRLLNE